VCGYIVCIWFLYKHELPLTEIHDSMTVRPCQKLRTMTHFIVWLVGSFLILLAVYFGAAFLLAIVEVLFYSEPDEQKMITKQELETAHEVLLQAQGMIADIHRSFVIGRYAQGARTLNEILGLLADQLTALDNLLAD
jgi:hypothetical protein